MRRFVFCLLIALLVVSCSKKNNDLEDDGIEIPAFQGSEVAVIDSTVTSSDNLSEITGGVVPPFAAFQPDSLYSGFAYYLLADRIRVRSEPNLNGEILGHLTVNTEVKIIECAFNGQVIDDFLAYWYKIEYNNSFGYIWGGNIAKKTLVYDIDDNGVNDYFHYRSQRILAEEHGAGNYSDIVDMNKDIFVYINNTVINNTFEVERRDDRAYLYCTIYTGTHFTDAYPGWDGLMSGIENVVVQFYANPWVYFFEVDQYGKIRLIYVWAK